MFIKPDKSWSSQTKTFGYDHLIYEDGYKGIHDDEKKTSGDDGRPSFRQFCHLSFVVLRSDVSDFERPFSTTCITPCF